MGALLALALLDVREHGAVADEVEDIEDVEEVAGHGARAPVDVEALPGLDDDEPGEVREEQRLEQEAEHGEWRVPVVGLSLIHI